MICISAIFLIASVSASDLNETDDVITNEASVDEINAIGINNGDENAILARNVSDDNILKINDNEDTLGVNYHRFVDIQNKIDLARPGDTIYLNGTYYGFGTPIVINKEIKLVGIGNTELKANVNTNLKQSAIYINQTASNVVIDNLKITGGCDQWGGGIYVYYAHKTVIRNCLFKDNSADGMYGYGGAIFLWAENCHIDNCTFYNNHCTDYGGAIYANRQNNKITNCIFMYNYISNELIDIEDQEGWRGGGAIYSDCQSLRIDNCTFIENYARESFGGALRLAASCSVQNSIFNDNVAKGAKAIYCPGTIVDLKYNTFSLDYKEDPNTLFEGVTADELKNINTFNKTRIDSSVKFSAGMIFEYGTSGSIYVTVDGGSIERDKIRIIGHNEARIDFINNVITVSNLDVGTYTLRVTTVPDDDHFSVDGDLKVTVKKSTAVIKAEKITVAYKKGSMWTIKLVNSKTNNPISNMKLFINVYTGKKFKTIPVTTNSKGEASYQTKGLSAGNHKVIVSAKDGRYNFNTLSSSIKVVKQTPLKFKVKKKSGKDGVSFSITVMNKKTNKPLNGVKIKVLLYEGKNVVSTIYLKTMKKGKFRGVCGYGTNKLSVGTHKVVIEPFDIKYGGSAKSTMKITKKHKRVPNWETRDTAK